MLLVLRPLPAPLLAPLLPAREGRAAPLSQPRHLMAEESREPPPRRRPATLAPVAGAAVATSETLRLELLLPAPLEPMATRPSPTRRRGPAAPSGPSRP